MQVEQGMEETRELYEFLSAPNVRVICLTERSVGEESDESNRDEPYTLASNILGFPRPRSRCGIERWRDFYDHLFQWVWA